SSLMLSTVVLSNENRLFATMRKEAPLKRRGRMSLSPDFYMFDLPEGYCFISKPSKIFISEADRD
ncbi:MAG: hypothetical protein K2H85_02270, partial [Allobaculum sp.]|nr:hypothetical protein [Allobaculum sp.]